MQNTEEPLRDQWIRQPYMSLVPEFKRFKEPVGHTWEEVRRRDNEREEQRRAKQWEDTQKSINDIKSRLQ
jgi:hypothetical protein